MRSKDSGLMLQIREYVEDCFENCEEAPTIQQIADAVGVAKATAYRYLLEMDRRQMLSYEHGRITTPRTGKLLQEMNRAALVGSVPCGPPEEREEQVEAYIPLPVSIFGKGSFYILRASGDSMTGAGICPGDLIVIEQREAAQPGDIIVALTDDHQSTLKRLCYDSRRGCCYLHPENEKYEDIYVKTLRVQGIARKVIKSL